MNCIFSSNIYAAIKSCTSNNAVIIMSKWVFALFYSTGEVKQIKSDLSLICSKTCTCVEKLYIYKISPLQPDWFLCNQFLCVCVCVCHNDLDSSLNKMCSAGGGQHNPAIAFKKRNTPLNTPVGREAGHYPEGCPVCNLETQKYTVQGPH